MASDVIICQVKKQRGYTRTILKSLGQDELGLSITLSTWKHAVKNISGCAVPTCIKHAAEVRAQEALLFGESQADCPGWLLLLVTVPQS